MKRMLLITALAVSIGAGATAHASVATDKSRAGKNDCVFARTINDFKVLDRNKMVIWAPTRSKAYLVELSMPLPELKFANSIAVVDRNHDGMVCGYGMDRIIVADSSAAGFRTPSTIMGMKRLDDAATARIGQEYDDRVTRKKVGQAPSGSAGDKPKSNSESP